MISIIFLQKYLRQKNFQDSTLFQNNISAARFLGMFSPEYCMDIQ